MLATLAAVLAVMPVGASARNTMRIDTTIVRGCQLAALPMMFGTIAVFLPNVTTQTSLFVECTPNTAFTVAIDDGLHFNGQRRMARIGAGFGNFLNYEIYRNAARTQRWGTSAAQVVTGTAPASGKVTLTAYGRANGVVAAGPFEDTVTVTITF